MRVTVNPEQQPSGNFTYAPAGDYTLRVVGCEEKKKEGSEFGYLAWKFEFADPMVEGVEKGPNGERIPVGNIFENTTLKPSAQFRLRDLIEAVGMTWGDFDPAQLTGMEFRAKVKTEIYDGKIKNVVDKYTPAKQ